MEAITLPIYNTEGKEIDSIKLDKAVFDGTINTHAIYQAINAYRANQRKGLASTKTRGEVSGGGRKPWRQKGTGRARVGSIRSPLWRHGGVIFGPHPRSFYYKLPQKIKNLALKSTLNAKLKGNNIIVLDGIKLEKPKTKEVSKIISNLKINPVRNTKAITGKNKISNGVKPTKESKPCKLLLLLDKIDSNLKVAAGNINFLNVSLVRDTHAYEVISHQKLIITKEAVSELTNRLKK